MNNLRQTRVNYTSEEMDRVLKQALYHQLKDKIFATESSHVKLDFTLQLEVEDRSMKSFSLCESCFVKINEHKSKFKLLVLYCYLYHSNCVHIYVALRTFREWKSEMKKSILVNGLAAESRAAFKSFCIEKKVKLRYNNVEEASAILKPLGIDEYQQLQFACVPDNPASLEAFLWMHSFFGLVGDSAPNRENKVQLPGIYTQDSIHHIYQHHVATLYTSNEHQPLERRAFETLWSNVFPNVSITKYCQVSGKCFSCHSLYERQEVFRCAEDLESIKKLSVIHKILIEMQRAAYMNNRQKAETMPDLYMSLIVDGMAQDHCKLPFYASKSINKQ
jgi:hypothetical protein